MSKPDCKICNERAVILDDVADELIYHIFNPYHTVTMISSPDERVKDRIPGDSSLKPKFNEGKEESWNKMKEMIANGESNFSLRQVVDTFFYEVLKELYSTGYVEDINLYYRKRVIRFTKKAEKAIGDMVISLSLQDLDKRSYGENVSENVLDVTESLLKPAMCGKIEINESELM